MKNGEYIVMPLSFIYIFSFFKVYLFYTQYNQLVGILIILKTKWYCNQLGILINESKSRRNKLLLFWVPTHSFKFN